ncbi:DNA topoisomerase IB [Sphingomonas sp. ID0503]|uniref:DNA topoisomerase IB n=1 Tax=Sphingomonas sp. ID0503 TaxID=3399691 RepID=UPI003AFB6216
MLCYVDDSAPGITRERKGNAWAYFTPKGKRIEKRSEIDRLNAIGLPPAYTNAWFCPSPHGHIQATGMDDKGRKQYRYHVDFRAQQEAEKYGRCADFGRALPAIRAQVEADLASGKLCKQQVVAAVVRILDLGKVRVGNDAYAESNKSFGATTLRDRHATFGKGSVSLRYIGKSGKEQKITIADAKLARLVKRCQDIPGQRLFQYLDSAGERHPVTSGDVNEYLKQASGGDFTAKHFRTWGASVIAFKALVDAGEKGIKIKQLLEPVAEALGNTPAISRKSYVHPALIALATGKPAPEMADIQLPRAARYLSREERGLIAFLDHLSTEQDCAVEAA